MLNGLTSQLMPTVTAMPRHCSATRCSAPKSTLSVAVLKLRVPYRHEEPAATASRRAPSAAALSTLAHLD